MKIFVTGATGVIGRRLVPILHEAGHDVTAVSRSLARRGELERAGAQVVALDLFDASAVRRAAPQLTSWSRGIRPESIGLSCNFLAPEDRWKSGLRN